MKERITPKKFSPKYGYVVLVLLCIGITLPNFAQYQITGFGKEEISRFLGLSLSDSDFRDGKVEGNKYFDMVKEIAESENAAVLPICAEIEAEISGMEDEEKELFLSEMGLEQSGLDRLINACYSLLGLISYLTAGKPEVRAWTIKKGTKAPQAAGKIHTDFERGFIRAEVVAFDDLMECGSMAAAKEKGLVRSEGKDYVMKDGDIVLFRFNV